MTFHEIRFRALRRYFCGDLQPLPDDYLSLVKQGPKVGQRLVARVLTGTVAGDMISTTIWSAAMISVLEECKATGFRSRSVRVVRGNDEFRGFRLMQVTGTGGPFDPKRSGATYLGDAIMSQERVWMDVSKWDGSDVFTIPGQSIAIFAVNRVAEKLLSSRLLNVNVIPAAECSFG